MDNIEKVAVAAVSAVINSRRSNNPKSQRQSCLELLTRICPIDKWELINELDKAEDAFRNLPNIKYVDKYEEELIVSRYEQAVDALVDAIIDEWEVK